MPIRKNYVHDCLKRLYELTGQGGKYTQSKLADTLGIPRPTVANWAREENGKPRGINDKQLEFIESLGYPREKWYIKPEKEDPAPLSGDIQIGLSKEAAAEHPLIAAFLVLINAGDADHAANVIIDWLKTRGRIHDDQVVPGGLMGARGENPGRRNCS